MEIKSLLTKALPWIGAAATGNVPALVALAAKEVGNAIGVELPAEPKAIETAVANATPEQLIALQDREMAFKERMQAMGFAHTEEVFRLGITEQKMYVEDTSHARTAHASDRNVFRLGVAVLVTFAITMGMCLYGAYQILTGGITIKDVAVVAAVSGFVGTVVGYVAANAQQVIAYFFGSSKGSQDKTNAMANAFKDLGNVKR